MRRAAVLVVLTLLCASACSGGGKSDVSAEAAPTTTTTASLPTADQLQGMLLTVHDLPAGWTVDTAAGAGTGGGSGQGDDTSGEPACLQALDDGVPATTVTTHYTGGRAFPKITESLNAYPYGQIQSEMDKAISVIDGCGAYTFSSDGQDFSGTISRLKTFPTLGDGSAAWDMELRTTNVVAHMTLVLVTQGNVAMSFSYLGIGDAADPAAQTYASAATAKL